MPVFRQETFGPVAAVIRAEDEEAAVDLANDTPYGLGASVWTRDLDRAQRLGRRIESGSLFVNAVVASASSPTSAPSSSSPPTPPRPPS
jgi:succinate-semialdehyde dehydrogenase / glutarate-semialdehyde dehydrogenase